MEFVLSELDFIFYYYKFPTDRFNVDWKNCNIIETPFRNKSLSIINYFYSGFKSALFLKSFFFFLFFLLKRCIKSIWIMHIVHLQSYEPIFKPFSEGKKNPQRREILQCLYYSYPNSFFLKYYLHRNNIHTHLTAS